MYKPIKKTTLALIAGLLLAMTTVTAAHATHVFTDVDDDKYYATAVEWARDNGITNGVTPTTFEPDRTVTRAQAVTLLNRYDANVAQPAFDDRYTKDEADAALATGLAPFGGMSFLAVDIRIDKGHEADMATVDGATIRVACADDFGDTDFRIYVIADADGWYMPYWDSAPLLATDEADFISFDEGFATPDDFVFFTRAGFSVVSPNGGYMEMTPTVILNGAGLGSDCVFRGFVAWTPPPAN